MKCGYCKSLQEDTPELVAGSANAKKASGLGILEFVELLKHVPGWAWILMGGMAVVAGVSFAADLVLEVNSLPRALWCTIQAGVSVLVILAAQIWALF